MAGAAEYQRSKTHCPQGHPYDEENTKHTKDGRACRACHRAKGRRRYQAAGAEGRRKAAAYGRKIRREKHPVYIRTRNARRQRAKKWLESQRLACIRCGENHPGCLDFHHRNPAEKEFQVGQGVLSEKAKHRVLAEIAKCDVLCANCHRKFHYDERNAV